MTVFKQVSQKCTQFGKKKPTTRKKKKLGSFYAATLTVTRFQIMLNNIK